MLSRWRNPALTLDAVGLTASRAVGPSLKPYCLSSTDIIFDFGGAVEHAPSFSEQEEFKAAFHQELAKLETWWMKAGWTPSRSRDLRISVSPNYKISRALVPAWEGRQGRMEFPTHRVVERKAAIIHELTHVFFPNGNRLLAEGLAVYMQHLIGGNPAFPNFGRPPHELMPEISREIIPGFRCGDPASLEQLSLARLDRIATPNPLTLQIGAASCGVDQKGQARLYTIAGSFTQFLIETYGLTKFWGLYRATPLLPSQLNAGALERWHEIFGCPLQALAAEWKVVICEITKTEEPRNA